MINENVRLSGLALIAGSVGLVATLGLHPTGRGMFDPNQVESVARALVMVHSLGLASLPLWFLGACGLSKRIGTDDWLVMTGLGIYGFALAAILNAVVFDGLVTPGLARAIVNAAPDRVVGWKIAFNYNALVDEAFLRVFLVLSSVAILLWSCAILRSGALSPTLGIIGCLLGTLAAVGQVAGLIGRNPHILTMVLLGQALWLSGAGWQLYREKAA